MWNTEPDPIVMSVAIHSIETKLTFIICYVPPFFSKSLTKSKTYYVDVVLLIISSIKYWVFVSPNSNIYFVVGGLDGLTGSSPSKKPIIILEYILGLSLVNTFTNF